MRISRQKLVLWSILAAGLILRLIGIDHGLPGIYHPDEPIVVSRAMNAVINGDWNPEFFHWPGLMIYLLAIEYEIIYLLGRLFGAFSNSEDFFKLYSLSRGEFHLWGRLIVAVMSTGIGYFVYLTLKVWKDNRTGIWGLAICAINPMLVKHAQFITPDIPSLFFASVCFYFLAKNYFGERKNRDIYLSAIFAGLAVATKYNYALMLVPIYILIFTNGDLKIGRKVVLALISSAITLGVFFVFNPFILLDFKTFLFQFNEISLHLKQGHIGMEAGGHPSWKIFQYLLVENGFIFILLALGGIAIQPKSRLSWILAILSFPILVMISHGRWDVTADRYALPIMSALLPLSAIAVGSYGSYSRRQNFLYLLLAIVMMIQMSINSIAVLVDSIMTDKREIAREWIDLNIPAESKIVIEKDGPDLRLQHAGSKYYNDPSFYFIVLTPWYGTNFRTELTPIESILENKPTYVIINSGVYSRYEPGAQSQIQFPEIYKVWRNYYNYLDHYGNIVYDSRLMKIGGTGPDVVIYEIPQSVYDSVLKIEKGNPDV